MAEIKRPLSAFMYFSKDIRAKVKEEKPDATFGEIGKIIGEKWHALTEEGRTPYVEMAAQDKARYDSAMVGVEKPKRKSKKTAVVEPDVPKRKSKKKVVAEVAAEVAVEPVVPKRPLSAFMYFSKDIRTKVKEEKPDATFGEIGKLIGEKWHALTDKEKAPYVALATQDKARYDSAMVGVEKPKRKVAEKSKVEAPGVKCAGVTKAGKPCQNRPLKGSAYCRLHQK